MKIDPYNFELYRFKLGAFFLRHSVYYCVLFYSRPDFFNSFIFMQFHVLVTLVRMSLVFIKGNLTCTSDANK